MWHKLSDKNIKFPSSNVTVLVANEKLNWWKYGVYSLISVENLLKICDKPNCEWTHWMEIPKIEN